MSRRLAHRLAHDRVTAWALGFWLFTYAVLSVRGRLLPTGPLDWVSPKRLVAISIGALIFWLALRSEEKIGDAHPAGRVGIALVASLLGTSVLLVARVGMQGAVDFDTSSLADEVRWLLLWNGYFIAWVGFFAASRALPRAAVVATHDEAPPPEPEFWVDTGQRRRRILAAAVDRVSAEGNYARLHAGADSGLIRMSMAQIAERLDPHRFVRLHRSAICRRDFIAAVARQRSGAFVATLVDGTDVPVGRRLGAALLEDVRPSRATLAAKR